MLAKCNESENCKVPYFCEHKTNHEHMEKWCQEEGCSVYITVRCEEVKSKRNIFSPTLQKIIEVNTCK